MRRGRNHNRESAKRDRLTEQVTATKHTPGPWTVDDRHVHCASGLTYPPESPANRNVLIETDMIVEVDTSCHPGGLLTETDKANLALIAAAPELLEACKLISNCATNGDAIEPDFWVINRVREAITKATGGGQ